MAFVLYRPNDVRLAMCRFFRMNQTFKIASLLITERIFETD